MADTLVHPAPTATGGPTVPVQAPASPPPNRSSRALARLLSRAARRSALVVFLLLLWEVLPQVRHGGGHVVEPSLLPPLHLVVQAWWHLVQNGQLWDNTRASLQRSLAGFAISVVVGVPLGLAIAWWKPVREVVNPLFEAFRNTAALALLPVFALFLGIGETSKIALVLYACIFPVLLNTISGVGTVDPLLVKAARSMGLSSVQLFRKVVVPATVPSIFTGIRQAGASSILILIAAEMVGAKAGLGYLVNYSMFNFMIPQMYAGILTISAIGITFNVVLVKLERRASRWRATSPTR